MTKISQLSSIGDSLAVDDQFIIRDVSDVSTPNKSVTVSGITRALDLGSAAAPAIAFASDKNTGIYSPGADQVAVATNGTGRLFIDAAGLVGVGNSAPSFVLDVSGGAGTGIRYQNTANSIGNILGADSSSGLVGTTTAHPLSFITGATEKVRIDTSGRVGIGTSTFSYLANKLVIDKGSTANDGITIVSSNTSNASIWFADGTTGNEAYRGGIDYQHSNDKLQFYTGGQGGTVIDSSGNVGLGSTGPTEKLHVAAASPYIRVEATGGVTGSAYYGFNNVAGGADIVSTSHIRFAVPGLEAARIDTSGRLLVGTSTGSQSLTIKDGGDAEALGLYRNFTGAGAAGVFMRMGRTDSGGVLRHTGSIGCESSNNGTTPGGTLSFSTTADGAASPTERMRITSTGQVRLAGAGITFNGDTAAANELDDYEEGTWTPTQGAGLTVVGTFTSNGHYTKIGRQVTVQGYISASTSVTAAANAIMCGGLPFTVMDVSGSNFIGGASNATLTALINVWANQVTTNLYAVTSMAATGGIYFTISYFTT